MQLPIYLYGQSVLRKETENIEADYPGFKELIANMFETLDKADGVGLAAPQVGLSIRLFIVDLTALANDDDKYVNYKKAFVNPQILDYSEETCSMEEGCLSVPDIHENVVRSCKVRIRYQDEEFRMHEETFSDYEARVIQHEYDHLEAKIFTDRISPIRRQLIKSKLTNILKGRTRPYYKYK
ncbi:MAG: peptide deformylase [Bacteroidota bacterium]|nr:peptide deformylase [Bacteroidota bacterium]